MGWERVKGKEWYFRMRGKKRGYQLDDQIFISDHLLGYWALW